MDILKYIDIMIGLAVVMVLLSPLVTATTQFVLWFVRRRSEYLIEGLQNLILQIQGHPVAIVDIVDGSGRSAPGALAALPSAASPTAVPFAAEIDGGSMSKGRLEVTCSGAAAALLDKVRVTLIPQTALDEHVVVTSGTDAAGRATMAYAYGGSPNDASFEADVTVLSEKGEPVAARLSCAVNSGDPLTLEATAATPARFVYPGAPAMQSPASYDVPCTVTRDGQALVNHTLRWRFRRNAEHDSRFSSTPLTGTAPFVATVDIPVMTRERARRIAWAVLNSPMVARGPALGAPLSWLPPFWSRCGEVIEREELIRLLLEFAAAEGAANTTWSFRADDREALRLMLTMNGIADPARSLTLIRARAQELERDRPGDAACVRQAEAIICGAKSDFVGKINNWFDQTMTRVTQRYAASARAVTVLAALVVAIVIQFDAVELLRRLSADEKFRASLLTEAKAQQERIDTLDKSRTAAAATEQAGAAGAGSAGSGQPAAPLADDEIEIAKAKRNEIDATLAKLRAPELSILPNRFVWQRPSEARLPRNPRWTIPYPVKYELVAGGSTYQILPRWQDDVLTDLKAAIESANAPVSAVLTEGGEDLAMNAGATAQAHVCARANPSLCGDELARPIDDVAEAAMVFEGRWPAKKAGDPILLIVGDQKPIGIPFDPVDGDTLSTLQDAVKKADPKVSVRIDDRSLPSRLIVSAAECRARSIRLIWNQHDPFSNVLKLQTRVPRTWLVEGQALRRVTDKPLHVAVGTPSHPKMLVIDQASWTTLENPHSAGPRNPNIEKLAAAINALNTNVEASRHRRDTLTLRSSGIGPLELRYEANHPKTNILNDATPVPWPTLATLTQPHLLGVIASWALLSLGAPFWYDMLKNLLKLRPAPAIAEEKQRDERARESSAADRKT